MTVVPSCAVDDTDAGAMRLDDLADYTQAQAQAGCGRRSTTAALPFRTCTCGSKIGRAFCWDGCASVADRRQRRIASPGGFEADWLAWPSVLDRDGQQVDHYMPHAGGVET